jgi:hypothetical protein
MNLLDLTDQEVRILGFLRRGGHLLHFTRYDGIELYAADFKPSPDIHCTNPVFIDLRDRGMIEIKSQTGPKKPNSYVVYDISQRGRNILLQRSF